MIENLLKDINGFLANFPFIKELFILIAILIVSFLVYWAIKKLGVRLSNEFARHTKTKFDDILIEHKVIDIVARYIPLLIIKNTLFLLPIMGPTIDAIINLLFVFLTARLISALLMAGNSYYELKPKARKRPIKSYLQVVIIIVYVVAIIIMIGILTHQPPWMLLSGLGAMTAVILLIFRDTILSFVAGLQINMYDLLHVGDWIEMPQFGADGDVVDIALHTIKVQNWDKSITIVPTYKILDNSFRNWRGMKQAGGRRIKRAIYIDQNSIKFCDRQMIERFQRIQLISDYVKNKLEELERYNREHNIDESVKVNGRRMTNIGTFRAYAAAYIKSHPKINQNLTKMVRQLPPGPQGLPIEIYAFTNDIRWEVYEAIQADIFDHLLAVVPEFGLRIFQNPSGKDFYEWSTRIHSNP
ncbi:MAG: mechanosensitive ion channel [Caldisericaceae bacterium]|nr:mechanosensitive ion channel [Caldisericaceae bacterium]